MRFWFVHSSEVPLREQVVQQVSLGVLSGELAAGERLPSIRELARRFAIHPNTVSTAYRELHAHGWVSYRRGSGVYVTGRSGASGKGSASQGRHSLDHLLRRTVAAARKAGIGDEELRSRLEAALRPVERFVLVEADEELARLVLFEIGAAGGVVPEVCALPAERFGSELQTALRGGMAAVMPSKAAAAQAALGNGASMVTLRISGVAASLAEHLPLSRNHLVGVVSHWPRFLEIARTMLIAAGFSADALLVREAGKAGWLAGLEETGAVVCDSLTANVLPPGIKAVVFPLLAEESVRRFVSPH